MTTLQVEETRPTGMFSSQCSDTHGTELELKKESAVWKQNRKYDVSLKRIKYSFRKLYNAILPEGEVSSVCPLLC